MTFFRTETQIEVPFYDLDPMNIVWHGNYIKYLEVARCDLLNKLNYNYLDMNNDGCFYPLATMDLKFIKPAQFGQKLLVRTNLEEIEPCIIMKYLILNAESNEKIFKAKSLQICVDINTGESRYNAPERLIERIKELKNV